MSRCYKVASVYAIFLLVVCLPALAGSVNGFSGGSLSGIAATSVSASFSSSTDKFSNAPRSLGGNSMFEDVKVTNSSMSGYSISEGSFSDNSEGSFSREEGNRCKHCRERVPEGGAEVTYLMVSGIAVFTGILISGKQRRTARSSQSI